MRELSVFVDESGDFGAVSKHSPYYLFSLVLHDQQIPIDDMIKELDRRRYSTRCYPMLSFVMCNRINTSCQCAEKRMDKSLLGSDHAFFDQGYCYMLDGRERIYVI